MKYLSPLEREEVIDAINMQTGDKAGFKHVQGRCMSWEQVREMSAGGMEIGAHSLSHSSLSGRPLDEAIAEINKSKDVIESNIKTKCLHFAFPFGGRKDYNQGLINIVKEAGFQSCLLNSYGYGRMQKDAFCFNRVVAEEGASLSHLLR